MNFQAADYRENNITVLYTVSMIYSTVHTTHCFNTVTLLINTSTKTYLYFQPRDWLARGTSACEPTDHVT